MNHTLFYLIKSRFFAIFDAMIVYEFNNQINFRFVMHNFRCDIGILFVSII